ncbi:SPOR domain-containing protein [Lacisediminimonas profundi]|uniref:SPOR domain-containing protein n=1 Tax=Lacisediminimonas profundi TaxID=2603856 RepID=UPI00124B4FE9|nr:SPOR domain-containing protein [Lacisediminimonas profundi]
MLKFVFACLLLVNGGLLAFQLGWFDALVPSGHEPQRIRNQINADKLRVLSPAQVAATSAVPAASLTPASSASASAAASASSTVIPAAAAITPVLARPVAATKQAACIELANLTLAESKRFETRLAALTLPEKPVRLEVREQSSHMVWIPPLPAGKEGADKKSSELRKLGINDFYVLQDNPAQRHGISLGVFKTEDAARAQLAKLSQLGVRSARIVEHKMPLLRVAYRLRGLEAPKKADLDVLKAGFPRVEEKPCEA